MPWAGQNYPGQKFIYNYVVDFLALAGNASTTKTVTILTYPFQWMLAIASSTGAFTFQIQDVGRQYYFQSAAVQSVNGWGTAQNPFPLLSPYIFDQNQQVTFTVTDTSGSSNDIHLTLNGFQIIQIPGQS